MDLELSDEQRLLAESAGAFVGRECPIGRVRALLTAPGVFDPDLWRAMGSLGWPGLAVGVEHGGAGQGVCELVVVCEALGHGAVPSPLITSAVLAAMPIALAGDDEQRSRWLPRLASGDGIGTMALLEPGMRNEWDRPQMPGGDALRGAKLLVPWGDRADVIVVAAADGLYVTEPGGGRIVCRPHDAMGGDALFALEFDDAPCERLGGPSRAADGAAHDTVLTRTLDCAAVARLADAVGAARRALELTVRHASDRHQFGRPIGSFQAVAHRCVDMRTDLDACRYLAYRAAWSLDHEEASVVPVAAAKAYGNDALRRLFGHAHQVHGAIGFSTEHDLHLFTERAKAFELSLGSTDHHLDRVADAMGLG